MVVEILEVREREFAGVDGGGLGVCEALVGSWVAGWNESAAPPIIVTLATAAATLTTVTAAAPDQLINHW